MIPSIAIVGGGAAGWMAAAALANAFRGRGRVQLIEVADDQPSRPAEGTLPSIRAFHEGLGIDEDDLVRQTKATFKLGTAFSGWPGPGGRFFHPFGSYGASIGTVGFHHAWLRLQALGEGSDLEAYSLAAAAASLGRFQRPSFDPSSVLSSYGYGLHLDPDAYAGFLREHALARGVVRQGPRLAGVRLRGDDGFIDALDLENGDQLSADLYVDCSSQGRLIRSALGGAFQDWSAWLPCDRMAWATSAPAGELAPYSRFQARASGWRWRMALQDRTASGRVYCSRLVSDEEATADLLGDLEPAASTPPSLQRFANGRVHRFWDRNCVALGEAAGVLAPLEGTRLHLIQSGVARLISLLPAGACDPSEAEEYNRLSIEDFDGVRDFMILLDRARAPEGAPSRAVRHETPLPDSLLHRIELFKSRGRITSLAAEAFPASSWLSVFTGTGVRPRRHHPFADGLDLDELRHRLHAFRTVVRQAAEAMPAHQAFIAGRGCASAVRVS